jgi:hypothetical protein
MTAKAKRMETTSVARAQELVANAEQRQQRATKGLAAAEAEASDARRELYAARAVLKGANRREIEKAKGK